MQSYLVLSGGYDTKNVGDYAMLRFFTEKAHEASYRVTLLSRHLHTFLQRYYGVDEIVKNFEYDSKAESKGNFFKGLNFGEPTDQLHRITRLLSESSGLVIGGGRLLVDFTLGTMRGPLAYWGTLVTLCKFLGVPVHIYAMTFIPLKTETGEQWVRYIVDNCETVTVRDQGSKDYLLQIGCRHTGIRVAPDPAFAMPWTQSPMNNGRIAVSARHISPAYAGMDAERYIDQMVWLCREISERGYRPVGIAHCYYGTDDPLADDRTTLKKIAERSPLEVVEGEMLDLEAYRRFYNSVDALIGIRRHAMLFAAVAGVPVLGICENENGIRGCQDIGAMDPLRLDFSPQQARDKLDELLSHKDDIAARQRLHIEQRRAELEKVYVTAPYFQPRPA
ncbi:polysaccharide pyruvyl transferase family protein [Marinobacteraceae bacterium S3BR75-40.1]